MIYSSSHQEGVSENMTSYIKHNNQYAWPKGDGEDLVDSEAEDEGLGHDGILGDEEVLCDNNEVVEQIMVDKFVDRLFDRQTYKDLVDGSIERHAIRVHTTVHQQV